MDSGGVGSGRGRAFKGRAQIQYRPRSHKMNNRDLLKSHVGSYSGDKHKKKEGVH